METLIDTDIFIDHLRGHEPAKEFFRNVENAGFSAVTEVELLSGESNEQEDARTRLLALLGKFDKVPLDNPIAMAAGDIRRSTDLAVADAIIAATALDRDATVITRNVKHFSGVPDLQVRAPY